MILISKNTFSFNVKYYKQICGSTIGGALSVDFSDGYMTKIEKDAIYLRENQNYINVLLATAS